MDENTPTPNDATAQHVMRSEEERVFEAKAEAIYKALRNHDAAELVKLTCSTGGLLNNTIRKAAWPVLLGADGRGTNAEEKTQSWRQMPEHHDEEQVQKDVDRAFVYYPKDQSTAKMDVRKASLSMLILKVLRNYPTLCYFQGYHDIAAVLLLVLDEEVAFHALVNLSLFRIRDYMLPTIKPAEKHLLLIPAILRLADSELATHISKIPVFYALAGTLTLYAHDIPNFHDITRLYDFLLAHEPVMAIYLFASIVIQRREQLLEIPAEDSDMIHFTLSKLSQQLDLEALIVQSLDLFQRFPPEKLPGRAWPRIPPSSVLKTSRDIFAKQEITEARRLIEEQKRLLIWEAQKHKLWIYLIRNRRPLASVSAAVLVAAASFWLRSNDYDTILLSMVRQMVRNRWWP